MSKFILKIQPKFKSSGHNVENKDIACPSSNIPDEVLWKQFKNGSETAFAQIFKQNASRLYSYGIKIVKDEGLVQDAIQDLFVELWDAKERLSTVSSIKSYLYKSLRRKVLLKTSLKRKKNVLVAEIQNFQDNAPSYELSLIEKQRFEETRRKLLTAIDKLSDEQREIIHLKFYGKLNYTEIADIMALDKKGVYNLIARTLQKLRLHFEGNYFLFIVIFHFSQS